AEALMLTHAINANPLYEFAADVRAGLTHLGQKELPSKYLYDDVGTALFEVISVLPEYGLTRADERLLRRHANDIVDRIDDPVIVAELGSGSGKKTRWLLEALCSRQQTYYCPIEISDTALAMCRRELSDLESISIVGFEREYLDGLLEVAARRQDHAHLLVLFLGSTIGNFDRPAGTKFLRQVRRILEPGDTLLLGTDLEKPVPQLIAGRVFPGRFPAAECHRVRECGEPGVGTWFRRAGQSFQSCCREIAPAGERGPGGAPRLRAGHPDTRARSPRC